MFVDAKGFRRQPLLAMMQVGQVHTQSRVSAETGPNGAMIGWSARPVQASRWRQGSWHVQRCEPKWGPSRVAWPDHKGVKSADLAGSA